MTNQYEWTKFLKNSYFNVGGYHISLFEIKNYFLTNNTISKKMYGEEVNLNPSDIRRKFIVGEYNYLIHFGIAMPIKYYFN